MSGNRRHFSAEQKAQIVRRHLAGKEPVSKLADESDLQPSVIHTWVKQALAQIEKAFERSPGNRRAEHSKDQRLERLEQRISRKNEVIAELMEENVRAKKEAGEL